MSVINDEKVFEKLEDEIISNGVIGEQLQELESMLEESSRQIAQYKGEEALLRVAYRNAFEPLMAPVYEMLDIMRMRYPRAMQTIEAYMAQHHFLDEPAEEWDILPDVQQEMAQEDDE